MTMGREANAKTQTVFTTQVFNKKEILFDGHDGGMALGVLPHGSWPDSIAISTMICYMTMGWLN